MDFCIVAAAQIRYITPALNPNELAGKSRPELFSNAMKTTTSSLASCPTLRALAVLLLALLAFSRAPAQTVPALVNYQGRLANPDGSPLPTADYTLTFNVYDAVTNGALVWGPQAFDGAVAAGHGARIPVVQGYFNVMLGPVDTTSRSLSDAFAAPNRYVEVTVSNRPPIAPRQQILTTPFAFQAANSAKLAGYDWSAVFGTNNPVAGTIPFSKLAQRQVGTNVSVGGVAVSQSTGNYWTSPSPNTSTAVSNLAVTLQTTGRPVVAFLTSAQTNVVVGYGFIDPKTSVTGAQVVVQLFRDGVLISSQYVVNQSATETVWSPGSFHFIDTVASPGNHTYEIRAFVSNGIGVALYIAEVRLVAYEL